MSDEGAGAGRAAVVRSILPLLLLVLPVLSNPLISPYSRFACHLLAGAGLLSVAVGRSGRRSGIGVWIIPLAPLGAASFLAASGRARAQDELATVILLLIAGLVGRTLVKEGGAYRLTAALMALGCGVSLHAVLQHHITYPELAEWLRSIAPADATGALVRLESGRPSGPFILPAALAGFLALCLPATLAPAFGKGGGVRRTPLFVAAALQVYALGLTRSLGGLAAAAVGVMVMIPALTHRHRRLMAAATIVVVALAALFFLQSRRGEIFSAPGADPLTLRAGNWSAAARMIAERPALGVGPGQFEFFYPRMMRPGMNETKYAHNSYLQAAACWGIWILVPLSGLIAALGRASLTGSRSDSQAIPFLAGGCTFLVHNLIDFTVYLPAVAIPAAIVIGAGLARGPDEEREGPHRSGRWGRRLLAAVAVALPLIWHGLSAARAERLLQEARLAADREEIGRALDLARRAAAARSLDPEPHAFVAQLILAHGLEDEGLRAEGEQASSRALALQRESAVLHHTRALFHQASGEAAPAYREEWTAHALNPGNPTYRPRRRTAVNREER